MQLYTGSTLRTSGLCRINLIVRACSPALWSFLKRLQPSSSSCPSSSSFPCPARCCGWSSGLVTVGAFVTTPVDWQLHLLNSQRCLRWRQLDCRRYCHRLRRLASLSASSSQQVHNQLLTPRQLIVSHFGLLRSFSLL